jgi:LasA protease
MQYARFHPLLILRGCLFVLLAIFVPFLYACQPTYSPNPISIDALTPTPALQSIIDTPQPIVLTPFPTRPAYSPGELVDYIAQTGDTLPALAVHFNTSVEEILAANIFIPQSATTLPPGMPMKIPIYYAPFWGSPYQILPDSLFVNGPAQVDFDLPAFIAEYPGWLNGYVEYAFGDNRTGAQIIMYVSQQFSISPRLLLALLEYQNGALTQPELSLGLKTYPLGYQDWQHKGLYLQLVWAANLLNNGYYGWRSGSLTTFDRMDGKLERPDPWQNAASVALQHFYAQFMDGEDYARAIAQDGFARIYRDLFGDPWLSDVPHIPGSLVQPEFTLPFAPGLTWAYTGGPHTGYGEGEPFAALDFAPGAETGGCTPTNEWATAVAPGVVARSELGTVVLDLDGDGDERTGWVLFYFHVGTVGRASVGTILNVGDPLGHPSCEGGRTTGTHIHIARKYNGEWILAEGPLAFNLEGWIAHNGTEAYQGTLTRNQETITACDCANAESQIEAGAK